MTEAGAGAGRGLWARTTPLDALAGHAVYWKVITQQFVMNHLISAVICVGAVGLLAVFDPVLPGYRPWLALSIGLGLTVVSLVYWALLVRWPRPAFVFVGTMVQPVAIGAAAIAVGPALADTVGQAILITAIVTTILLPRFWGNLILALACAGYGVALLFHSSDASLMRFVVLTAQVALFGTIVRRFSNTVFQLAGAERNARARAEDAQAELQVVDERKREFLARMSHELRTPLNAIIGFSDVLRDQLVGPLTPKQREYVDDVASSGRHLLELVDDILDVTAVEGGRLTLEPTRTRLHQVIESSVALFREQAERAGITVTVSAPASVGVVVADERKVKQILLNLLANAFRFTPPGGQVNVVAKRTATAVEVSVSDTGPGIDRADHDRIFAAYVQAGVDHEGTGLGLALSRRFAEMHGGSLEVASRPGAGATFLLVLPLVAVEGDNADDDVIAHAQQTDVGMWDRGGVLEQLVGEAGLRRFLARIAGTLAMGEGLTLLVVAALPHPVGFHANWMLTVAAAAFAVGVVMLTPGRELGPGMAYLVGFVSVVAIAALTWLAGSDAAAVMASIFVLHGITTFMGLTLRRAWPVGVAIGAAYAVVVAVQDVTGAALIAWLLTMGMLASGALLARWLVNFVPTLAHAERQARTEAEEANAALIAASRHKSEFLANMSHELRTPLNAILGFSEVLAAQVFGPLNSKQAEYVDDVVASGHHLLVLINDILDLAKADAGRLELDLVRCDLCGVVEAATALSAEDAAEREIQFSVETPQDETRLVADPARLTQAITCLVANALAFTPPGGRVTVSAAGDGATAVVTVRDTGPGIDPHDHERIFTEFEHSSRQHAGAGSGIGLALARCLVELHGGQISLESALGEGSAFTIRLPMIAAAPAPVEEALSI